MIPTIVLLLSMLIPVGVAIAVLLNERHRLKREGRRSPLADKLYHGPGEQLRLRIADHDDEIQLALMLLFAIGPMVLAAVGLTRFDWSRPGAAWSFLVPALFVLLVTAWATRKLLRNIRGRRAARQGIDGERMTAQQLLPLMAQGCLLYHDIPAGKFNLDHVVIGPHGVFVVETKSRQKPPGKGKDKSTVHYDGTGLRFPDFADTQPIEQARSEARWLADYLRGAAGEAVTVFAVVALPGWFVAPGKDAARSDVTVINPKMHSVFLDGRRGSPISDSLRNRIAHALVQRYPEIE